MVDNKFFYCKCNRFSRSLWVCFETTVRQSNEYETLFSLELGLLNSSVASCMKPYRLRGGFPDRN